MADSTVKSGKYRGFTLAELHAQEALYKQAVLQRDKMQAAAGGGLLNGGDAGGANVSFDHSAATLEQWRADLDFALSQVDEDADVYATDKFQASFR